jgi:hypothetical protein
VRRIRELEREVQELKKGLQADTIK